MRHGIKLQCGHAYIAIATGAGVYVAGERLDGHVAAVVSGDARAVDIHVFIHQHGNIAAARAENSLGRARIAEGRELAADIQRAADGQIDSAEQTFIRDFGCRHVHVANGGDVQRRPGGGNR